MDSFDQRKKSVLEKEDKASKGSWDERGVDLCNKLNSLENYYTTSSCSGKAVIMEERTGKDGSYYLWTSHGLIILSELKEAIDLIRSQKLECEGMVKFKSESPIFFVCCRNVDFAKILLDKAVKAGFKESGIKITNKLVAVEIRSVEKIEFPLIFRGDVLVDDDFLKILVEGVNFRRERGWKKIISLFEFLN
jgi:tRNA wybutosine-synthesizing protein 3